jgi:chitodextrinase
MVSRLALVTGRGAIDLLTGYTGTPASGGGTADTTAPSVPTNVTASSITSTGFALNWTASTDDVAVTSYSININGSTYQTSTTNSATIAGLNGSTTYTVRVTARDAVGNFSGLSTAISVTTTAGAAGSTIYPDASSTGVPAGTTLTTYTGSAGINTANTIIENKIINMGLVIGSNANNVIIRNCRINVGRDYNWCIDASNGASGTQILDCELIGGTDSTVAGSYTMRRCNISGSTDGLKVSACDIQDSYIHDLYIDTANDTHNDGIQCLGTTSLTIKHNRIIMGNGSTSAVLLSTGSATDMRNVLIDNNLCAGGAYTIYGGYQAGADVLSRVSNITVSNNKISTVTYANGGFYGPFSSVDSPVVLTGNTWYDGPKAGQAAP